MRLNVFGKLSDGKKSALAYMIASYIHYAISFIVTPVFSRLLTTADFGLVSTFISWVEIVGPIASLSLYAGYFNIGLVENEGHKDRFESAIMGLSIVCSVVAGALFAVCAVFFKKLIGLPISLLILIDVYFIVYPATRIWQARERFEYRWRKLFFVMIPLAVLTPVCGLLSVLTHDGNGAIYRLYGTHLVNIAISFALMVSIFRKGKCFYDGAIWKDALIFCVPLIPHYLAMHVLAAADKIMINNMVGSSEAGIYGMAYTASMVVTEAWTAINGALSPYVLKKLKANDLDGIGRTSTACIILFSCACLLVCVVAPEVITVLGGKKYAESINLLPPLLASVMFAELYNLFAQIEYYYKKTKMIMLATVSAAVLNVVLNYFCIRHFGYRAAAYTTLICYILYCIFHYLNMRRIEKRKIYPMRIITLFAAAYTAACFGCLALYRFPVIRYSVLAAALIAGALCYKKIVSVFRNLNGYPETAEHRESLCEE